ncbi:hypothetical protein SAMN02910289_00515 [Lachnospiraceae bacterium RM5]|nr:hypothetical protein SAMN02910289_00515 [Lachnospiraceae bacterium RM5]
MNNNYDDEYTRNPYEDQVQNTTSLNGNIIHMNGESDVFDATRNGNGYNGGYGSAYGIDRDEILSKAVTRSFIVMFAALLVSLVTAIYTLNYMSVSFIANSIMPLCIAEIVVVLIATSAAAKKKVALAGTLFLIYAILNGITLSVIALVYTSASIVTMFLVTALMFGGMAFIGLFKQFDFLSVGSYLIMGLWGIIIASIVNLFLHSSAIETLICYVGVAVFLGLTAYDVQKIKKNAYESDGSSASINSIALLGGINLYLDFINLLLKLLRLFGKKR